MRGACQVLSSVPGRHGVGVQHGIVQLGQDCLCPSESNLSARHGVSPSLLRGNSPPPVSLPLSLSLCLCHTWSQPVGQGLCESSSAPCQAPSEGPWIEVGRWPSHGLAVAMERVGEEGHGQGRQRVTSQWPVCGCITNCPESQAPRTAVLSQICGLGRDGAMVPRRLILTADTWGWLAGSLARAAGLSLRPIVRHLLAEWRPVPHGRSPGRWWVSPGWASRHTHPSAGVSGGGSL